jgi:hypothetical protein
MGFTRHHKGMLNGRCITICEDGKYAVEEFIDDKKINETVHKPELW